MFSSHTFPPEAWSAPLTQGTYQRPYEPLTTSENGSIPQQQRGLVMQQKSQVQILDQEDVYPPQTDFVPRQQHAYTLCDDAFKPRTYMDKSEHRHDLGILPEKQGGESVQSMYSGGSSERFEDSVNADEVKPWVFGPISSGRTTWSSLPPSDREALSSFTGLTDINAHPNLSPDSYPCLGLDENNGLSDHFQNNHGNSTSKLESFLSPYPSPPRSGSLNHARSSSASTATYFLPSTECCSPRDDFCDDFVIHHLDHPVNDTLTALSDKMSGFTTPSFGNLPLQFFDVPNHQYLCSDFHLSMSYDAPIPSDTVPAFPPLPGHVTLLRNPGSTQGKCDSKLVESTGIPNLFGPLQEEQLRPDPEDMAPEDIKLTPGEQELRFEGDLYTPKYVRGHGHKREGWCGICKPGRWLILKNSAFWYDKSFTHGISAASGMAFDGPKETRRMNGNPEVWEGLCGGCDSWIALISSKKKGTTWFRHAYKCHKYPKSLEAPKKRRESTQRGIPKTPRTKKAKRGGYSIGEDSPNSLISITVDDLDDMLDIASGTRNISALQTIPGPV